MTSAASPIPLARPRTNVVFPAPSSPIRSTRSPRASRGARPAAAASVSSGEVVTSSVCLGEMVVASVSHLDLLPTPVHHRDSRAPGELAYHQQAARKRIRAATDQLYLLTTGQGPPRAGALPAGDQRQV